MRFPFWLNPVWIAVIWTIVSAWAWLMPAENYYVLMRSVKYASSDSFFISLICFMVFALGALVGIWLAQSLGRNWQYGSFVTAVSQRGFHAWIAVLFVLCMAAYLIWFGPVMTPSAIVAIASGEWLVGRTLGNQISGITTLTQLGIPLVVIAAYIVFDDRNFTPKIKRYYTAILFSIIAFSFFRSIAWGERLAIVELLVPVGTVWVLLKHRGRIFYQIAPFFAVICVIAIFGFFEYFRSWNFYREYYDSIITFSVNRFSSYYLSSFNNMALMIDEGNFQYQPLNTLDFVYRFPVPGNPLIELKQSQWVDDYVPLLNRFNNPEFNLFSGVGLAISDFGIWGGAVSLSIWGMLSGILYSLFKRETILGLLIFPIWATGLFDLGRIMYWPLSRAFPAFIISGLLCLLINHYARAKND